MHGLSFIITGKNRNGGDSMMILPFNRKVVYEGISVEHFYEVQDQLVRHEIPFKTDIDRNYRQTRLNVGQEIGGPASENMETHSIFRIYVHKDRVKDVKEALIHRRKNRRGKNEE